MEREVRWPEIAAMARLGEAIGFDSIWVGDHLLYRDDTYGARGPWEAWTQLAGIAAVTSRIALGPLVACTSFHNPAMLAKLAGTVDEISGGRLILGLGAGWNETEYQAYGFPYDRRVARFAEAFTIIRSLIREGHVDFAGEFYTTRDCELLPRPRPDIPLLIGSSGSRMLEITVPHVDAWNAWYRHTGNKPEGVAALRDTVDAACRAAGRDPAEIERTVAVLIELPGGSSRKEVAESALEAPALMGSPQEIADELRRYARAGVGHVQLVVEPMTESSLEALAPVLQVLDDSPIE
ncbi:MAG TPA: LLM class flavin-dependent oxidoreductase [Candidatus Dormibacteraeota bacterium]|nr:LLM class flavin-dependent oxidoreductase [Candidatus Dormibacteraeota bacterium]